jgi:hypothetical protein
LLATNRALKYLKNNKAASADSIAAELLKNGGPNLVDALHAVIHQAWTGETLPRSWTEEVAHDCDMLRQNTKRLFRILWNLTRIKTGRRIIYAVFQCLSRKLWLSKGRWCWNTVSDSWRNWKSKWSTIMLSPKQTVFCAHQSTISPFIASTLREKSYWYNNFH